jgi:hypothetical protein
MLTCDLTCVPGGRTVAKESDVLWGLYLDQVEQGRHHESMRATVTNLILTISAGAAGVIALDQRIDKSDFPLSLFIVLAGVVGAMMAVKHYERVQFHTQRSRVFRRELERLLPETKLNSLIREADNIHNEKWKRVSQFKLSNLWVGLQIGISLFGVILLVIALFFPIVPPPK